MLVLEQQHYSSLIFQKLKSHQRCDDTHVLRSVLDDGLFSQQQTTHIQHTPKHKQYKNEWQKCESSAEQRIQRRIPKGLE